MILGLAPIAFRAGYESWWTWTVLRDVRRGQSSRYSAEGFSRVGPRSVQALREALRSDRRLTRLDAAQSLGVIGREANPAVRDLASSAVPDLVAAALHDPDREVRMRACASLGGFEADAAAAVEPLVALLRSLRYEDDPQLFATVVESLGRIGPAARPAIAVLAAMARDPANPNRVIAAQSLGRIGPEGRVEAMVVVPSLLKMLAMDQSPREREWAARVLGELRPPGGEAVPALRAALQDNDPVVRRSARRALEAMNLTPSEADPGERQQ